MESPEAAKSQIQNVVEVLLNSATDTNLSVSDAVTTTLRKISKVHCNDVLKVSIHYCKKEPKISREHLARVMLCIKHICQEYATEIDENTVLTLIGFTIECMTHIPALEHQVQESAAEIFVALGDKSCPQVVNALLKEIKIGIVPHHAVLHTFGSLANTNALGIVPHLPTVLDLILPLMNKIKQDYQKQALAYALGRFSDAINEYVNSDQRPDLTITMETFYNNISTAYDYVSSHWLNVRDAKLVEAALFATGSMFKVLSMGKISQETPRIIPNLISLYKKQKEPLPITHCLVSIIQVAIQVNGMMLEPFVGTILHTLSELICTSPDYAQPNLLRNHSEVLRCYEAITSCFTDNSLDYLVALLQGNNEKDRVKALIILTHLTNSCETAIQSKVHIFLQIILEFINEPNIRVKKVVLKTVVAFANKSLIPPESQEKYLEFIVKLCCKQHLTKNMDINGQELDDLQRTADNTLYMLSTSVSNLEQSLWHLLLKCFLLTEYWDARIIILRCLTHLAAVKNLKGGCEDAFIRCLALLAQPIDSFLGTYILNFLKNITILDVDTYKVVWETKILYLFKYLEQNYDSFNPKEWEDLLFDFLNLFMQNIFDYRFSELMLLKCMDQLVLYGNKSPEKWLLLKCLATMTCNVQDENIVNQVLETVIGLIRTDDDKDIQACALTIGICSRTHLKLVLQRLGSIRKEVFQKKQRLLNFSFMSNHKHDIEAERMRHLVLYGYTDICNEAPADLLLQTVQSEILDFAAQELSTCKDFAIKQACIRTIGAVADVMHPNRNTLHIQMEERNKILSAILLQVQLHSGPEYIELYPVIIPVITSLIRLPPALEREQRIEILKVCFDNIYNGSAIYCKISEDNSPGIYYGDLKMAPFVYNSFSKLNFMVKEILVQNLNPGTLDEILSLLEPWLCRKKAEQRLPALETLRDTFQVYLDDVKFAFEGPTTFTQSGFLVARIVPRCFDSNKNIRKVAIDSLRLVLCITGRYEGHLRDHDNSIAQSLLHIQQDIDSDNPKTLGNLIPDLAHIIVTNLPQLQLAHFVNFIADAFLDIESSSSSSSAFVLNLVLKSKGNELQLQIIDLLRKLVEMLNSIRCPKTHSTCLRCILTLALHHPKLIVTTVLGYPLPYDNSIRECWSAFSTDPSLMKDILDQFKHVFKNNPLYEPHENSSNSIVISLQPLQVVSAMSELFRNNQCKELCKSEFCELFVLFYITLASYIDTSVPATNSINPKKPDTIKDKFNLILNREACKLQPAEVCLEAFRTFLICCEYTTIAEVLTGRSFNSFHDFTHLVPSLTEKICVSVSQNLAWMIGCLTPYLQSDLEPQRVASALFLAHVVEYRPGNQSVLTENILESLLSTQSDSSCKVREVGLKGLGNCVQFLSWELVSRHCNSILNAFMQGLDYSFINSEASVILEAMRSFSKLLKVANESNLSSCQVTAAMRIKPLFEQEDPSLRVASFSLLGDLASSINHDKNPDAFKDQVCGNFISLVLHLCDDDLDVVKACKHSLRKVGPFLNSPEVNTMLQNHLLDDGSLHTTDFVVDLIKVMNTGLKDLFPVFIMTSVSYFKSPCANIRGFATFLTGLLYYNLNPELVTQVPFDTVCYKVLQLLKDENNDVRVQAVQTISYLFTR